MKIAWLLLLGAFGLTFFSGPAGAAMEFKIDGLVGNPTEINFDQEVEIIFSFSNVSSPKTYYLAGVFQKEAGNSYFGWTLNNNWYKYGDDFTNFYKADINEGSFSAKLKVKPDPDSGGFKGTGEYQLKIFRYCTSQNACGETNQVPLKIRAPQSPSPQASVSTSVSGTSTPVSADSSPLASPLPSIFPSPTPTASKIYRIKEIALLNASPLPVLGTQSSQIRDKTKPDRQLITLLLTTGTGLLSAAAVIIVKLWRKS